MMLSFKSFLCQMGTVPLHRTMTANVINGHHCNGWTFVIGKRFFRTQFILKGRLKKPIRTREASQYRLPILNSGDQKLSMSMLWKPFFFTVSFSVGAFVTSALVYYRNMELRAKHWYSLPHKWYGYPDRFEPSGKRYTWREELHHRWNNLTEGEKFTAFIVLSNVVVYAMWKVPMLQTRMLKYFCSNPSSNAVCWPLALSMFSHFSLAHLAFNMCALVSFSKSAIATLGKEQFAALYFTGGVISSFCSLFFRVATKSPRMSLGASGAIMAVIGYLCTKYPNMELAIIGVPWYTFKAGNAIYALLALDLTGLIFRWRFLDHAAHLGGAIFGIMYCHWGNEYIWKRKDPYLQRLHEWRNANK